MKIRKVYDFEKNNVSKQLLDEISFQKYFLINHILGGVIITVTVTISGWKYYRFQYEKIRFENIFHLENGFYPNR